MTLSTLLAQFDIRQPLVLEREFVTALGAPKAVVRIETSGERLFVGTLAATWPGMDHKRPGDMRTTSTGFRLFWRIPITRARTS